MKLKQIIKLLLIYFFVGNLCQAENRKTIIEDMIAIPTNKVKQNIKNNEFFLDSDMENKLSHFNNIIDKEVNSLFEGVERNIDSYLNFHYSVAGEYTELYISMTGDIEKEIKHKLLGLDFDKEYNSTMQYLNREYKTTLKHHMITINKTASEGIDMERNKDIFDPIIDEIKSNTNLKSRMGFTVIGATAGVAIGTKIASVLAAKIIYKVGGKAAIKGGGKLIIKEGAVGIAAIAGVGCGPAVWICSPIFATVAWFGTDVIVVSADEALNRDDLKHELISFLNTMNFELKKSLQNDYGKEFKKVATIIRNTYKNTTVVELQEIKDRDNRVGSLFE